MEQQTWGLVLCLLLLVASSFPAWAQSPPVLTFAQAVELMNEHNIALQIAQLNLELAELDYQKAVAANLLSGSQQGELQAEHSLARARNTYLTAKRNNYLEVFRAYNDVLAARRTLEIRELERILAEHNYSIVQEKVRLGDAGRLEDLQELNRVEAARRNELTAQQNLAERERHFRRLTGLDEDEELVLEADFPLPSLELTLGESIELGLENSFALYDQQFNLQLQERQLEAARLEGSAPIDLQRAELSIKVSRLNLEQERASLVENITSAYHSLADNLARLTSSQRDWEIAQETFEIYRQQAEAGLITDMQLLQQRIALLNSQHSLEEAKVAYLVSFLQFQHLLGLDGDLQ